MFCVPPELADACALTPERRAWLEQLPEAVAAVRARWALSLDAPFVGPDVSCAWVAPARMRDGTRAVLKLGMPHLEGEQEYEGLRFWNGDPTVRVLAFDSGVNAMLLERCEPGSSLRALPDREQDGVVAALLRRLWRAPGSPHPFRSLEIMIASWAAETRSAAERWTDAGLVEEGLRLMADLSRPAPEDVLLATDLHAGNVLRATREPWLVIDPKPFVGDRAFDGTQHLLDRRRRLRESPDRTVRSFADRLEVDAERLRLWLFARAIAEPRCAWDEESVQLAHALA
jgi:streptomycin 6-kinase